MNQHLTQAQEMAIEAAAEAAAPKGIRHTACPAEILNVVRLGSDNCPDEYTQALIEEGRDILETVFENDYSERWMEVDASPEFWHEAAQHQFTITLGFAL